MSTPTTEQALAKAAEAKARATSGISILDGYYKGHHCRTWSKGGLYAAKLVTYPKGRSSSGRYFVTDLDSTMREQVPNYGQHTHIFYKRQDALAFVQSILDRSI